MSILKRQVNSSSIFSSFFIVMTHNSSGNFKLIHFYFGQKDPIKVPILALLSALVKIRQIPHVIFQTTSQFFFKFCITPLYVFSSSNIYFAQKEPIKVKVFETFKCSGQNLSNYSSCQFSNGKSIPLQILYHSSVS